MHSRRDAVLLVVAVVVIVVLAALTGSRRRQGYWFDPRPSTYLSTPNGAKALADVLRELNVPLARRMRPFVDAEPLRGPLAVLSPSIPPSPGEAHALAQWVRGGGTLLYAANRYDLTADTLGLRLRSFASDTSDYAEMNFRGIRASASAAPVAEGVGVVDGFRRGFRPESRALRAAVVLASTTDAAVVVDYRLGKGRVIAWSDALPLVNARLGSSRAAILFARTAVDAGHGGRIWFDEYHHGFASNGSPVGSILRFLARQPLGHLALQIAVAVLGVLLLFGRRFGAPLPAPPARRRSPLEHVEALAGAYLQADAHDTARRLLLAGLARRLGRRVPPTAAAEGEMLERLAAHPTAGGAARALESEWKKGRAADLVALSRDVDRYLEEVTRT